MFSILIQGPLHQNSLNNIENYRKFGEVFVSTTSDIPDYYPKMYNASFIHNIQCDTPKFNDSNIYNHAMNIAGGLKYIDTEFVIKVRSDEYYTDLSKFIEIMRLCPHCYVTNNIFFETRKIPLHPSDHVIGSKTSILKSAMKYLLDLCVRAKDYSGKTILPSTFWDYHIGSCGHPETYLFLSWLKVQNIDVNEDNMHKIMCKYTKLIPIDHMGQFVWSVNGSVTRRYYHDSYSLYREHHDIRSITQY